MIRNLLKKIIGKTGYIIVKEDLIKKDLPEDILRDKKFVSILDECKPFTMVSPDRSFALYKAVNYLSINDIQGDFVECGVWKGGQAMIMAHTLLQAGDKKRRIWLYDTYTGMSKPAECDTSILTGEKALSIWERNNEQDHNKWCYASLEEVSENLAATGYPKDNLIYVRGKVEDTIPNQAPKEIALLRLDTDWYESTRHELNHLFPRLVKGGVLIIDDYGSWEGSRSAVDEYILKRREKVMLMRIGTGAIGVKV